MEQRGRRLEPHDVGAMLVIATVAALLVMGTVLTATGRLPGDAPVSVPATPTRMGTHAPHRRP